MTSRKRSGSTTPTIQDVARTAGVAIGTVSRVLNGNNSVRPETRMKVEAAIRKLGYMPNETAQNMRRRTTKTVAIIVRDISISFFSDFVRAAQRTLEEHGYALLMFCSEDKKENELSYMRLCNARHVDGLIMTTCSEADDDLAAARAAALQPIVYMDRMVPGMRDSTAVSHRAGTREAVEHLLELGHRRIALITGSESLYPGRERVAGYLDAVTRRNVTPDMSLISSRSYESGSVYSETVRLLQSGGATAIIAGGVDALPHVVRAVRALGLRIPHDVSVISGADSYLEQLHDPPIAALRWSMAEIGRAAAQLLLDRIGGGEDLQNRRLIFPVEFVPRASCAAPGF